MGKLCKYSFHARDTTTTTMTITEWVDFYIHLVYHEAISLCSVMCVIVTEQLIWNVTIWSTKCYSIKFLFFSLKIFLHFWNIELFFFLLKCKEICLPLTSISYAVYVIKSAVNVFENFYCHHWLDIARHKFQAYAVFGCAMCFWKRKLSVLNFVRREFWRMSFVGLSNERNFEGVRKIWEWKKLWVLDARWCE